MLDLVGVFEVRGARFPLGLVNSANSHVSLVEISALVEAPMLIVVGAL